MLNFWYLIERSKQGLAVGSNQDIKQKFGPVSYFLNYSLYSEGCAGYQTVLVNPLHQFAEVSLGEPVHIFSTMANHRLVLCQPIRFDNSYLGSTELHTTFSLKWSGRGSWTITPWIESSLLRLLTRSSSSSSLVSDFKLIFSKSIPHIWAASDFFLRYISEAGLLPTDIATNLGLKLVCFCRIFSTSNLTSVFIFSANFTPLKMVLNCLFMVWFSMSTSGSWFLNNQSCYYDSLDEESVINTKFWIHSQSSVNKPAVSRINVLSVAAEQESLVWVAGSYSVTQCYSFYCGL